MADEKRPSVVRYAMDNPGNRRDSATDNNGYIRTTILPMDFKKYNPYFAWLGLKNNDLSKLSRNQVQLLAGVVVILAINVYFFQDSLFQLLHTLCGLFSPMFSVICAFYWLALYLRKSWTGSNVYVFFFGCYFGEVVGQMIFGTENIFSTWLVTSVLVAASLVSLTSTLATTESALVITFLSVMRFMTGSTLHGLALWLRPYFAYFCGIWGCVLARYTESNLFKHSPFHLANHFSPDGKIPVIRRRRTSSQSSTASHSHKTRRTSLPALIQKNACSSAVDLTVMQEAHGLIMDMLADKSLPLNVISGLKTVSSLLSPPVNFNTLQRPKISPLVALNESIYTMDMDDSPYVGERPLSLPKRLRRSLPPSLIRRMSSTWTTTTSATGMPTLEPQPLRTRSSSFRHSRDSQTSPVPGDSRSNSPAPTLSPHADNNGKQLRSHSVGTGGGLSPRSASPTLHGAKPRSRSASPRGSFSGISANEDTIDSPSRLELPSFEQLGVEDSAFDSRKSMTLTITQGVLGKEEEEKESDVGQETDGEAIESDETLPSINAAIPTKKRNSVTICESVMIIENDGSTVEAETITADEEEISDTQDELLDDSWDPTIQERNELLSQLDEWDYPIFDLWDITEDRILSNVAYRLFMDAGIFETFRLPVREFMKYFEALEDGYKNKPYHNRVHAADVLHAVYYMCTQQIPGFTQVNPEDLDPLGNTEKDEADSAFHTPTVTPRASLTTDSSYGILALNLPALELMALFTAAAMHDYDHPGRTNAFLVATKAPQAILYNDRSVLENHHAAQSWNLFFSNPEYNFLSSLDDAEFRRFRFLVVELILATDLKRHFDFLVEFNAKVNDIEAPGINWASEGDRLLVAQMCIKLCDISGPTKQKDLHVNWTMRISEEFYEQGDDERNLGLPVSPYMDRDNSQLAKLQEGFINHLVAPLCNAYGSAGLLPGQWLDEEDEENNAEKSNKDDSEGSAVSSSREKENDQDPEEEEEEEDDSSSDGTGGDSKLRPKSSTSQKTRKMVSILTKHLKENHDFWLKTLREEDAEKGIAVDDENTTTSKTNMAPIREDSEERISDSVNNEDSPSKTMKDEPKTTKTVLVEQQSLSVDVDNNQVTAQTPAVVLEKEDDEDGGASTIDGEGEGSKEEDYSNR